MKVIFAIFLFLSVGILSCDRKNNHAPYTDVTHQSAIFHHPKYFRLYLPDGYEKTSDRFSVIYFFHGWGGRHYKDDNAKLEYTKIKDLVDKYNVILVMWDGNYEEKEPRPYNVGYHEDITSEIQMKDYFLELVSHIDSSYKTLPDRGHRGIIGFSMGGFLSYFLAGKYPDKVSAAVNMTGSPEFYVGTPQVHTLYPIRYAFKNLRDVRLRFHNSTADELTYLNAEVDKGARWEGGLSYDYWQFVGGHVVDKPGETDVFERAMKFVAAAFDHPLPEPKKWTHVDLYQAFDLWGYHVRSDKHEPGFIDLKRVTPNGFGVATAKWLPDGPPLNVCKGNVSTAPIYQPNKSYQTKIYYSPSKPVLRQDVRADEEGRLQFNFDQQGYELGIYTDNDVPQLICTGYSLQQNRRYLQQGEDSLTLTLFNRSNSPRENSRVSIKLTSPDSSVRIANPVETMEWNSRESVMATPVFRILSSKQPPADASPPWIKFNVRISLDELEFDDELEVPVYFDVPAFGDLHIDDGKKTSDSVLVFGKGNSNGKAGPGEEVMVYSGGHRLRLYTDDAWVVKSDERIVDEVLPAKWPDGFTITSVIKIDPRCPKGHNIECLASYETKSFMPIGRKVTWGSVILKVER